MRLRLVKIDEFQLLTCIRHGLWGAKTAKDKNLVARLRELRNFRANGRKSLTKITEILNEEGFRTRRGTKLKIQNVSQYVMSTERGTNKIKEK